jgi:hypothetical protein
MHVWAIEHMVDLPGYKEDGWSATGMSFLDEEKANKLAESLDRQNRACGQPWRHRVRKYVPDVK